MGTSTATEKGFRETVSSYSLTERSGYVTRREPRRTDEYRDRNREHREELAALHPNADFHDVETVLDGESSLGPFEREDGFFELPEESFPLTFSLRAHKPRSG